MSLKDQVNVFATKFIAKKSNECILVTQLYKCIHKYIHKEICPKNVINLFVQEYFKSEPVLITQFCRYGWIGYKIIQDGHRNHYNTRKTLIEFMNTNVCIKKDSIISMDSLWKKYKEHMLNIHNKQICDKKRFYELILVHCNTYCSYYNVYNCITPKIYSDLREYFIEFFLKNIVKGHSTNKIRLLTLWVEIKKHTHMRHNVSLKFSDKKIFMKTVKDTFGVDDDFIHNAQFKYSHKTINELCGLSFETPTKSWILNENEKDIENSQKIINKRNLESCPSFNSITAYFSHQELLEFIYSDVLNKFSIALFNRDDDNVRIIDSQDYRPIVFRNNARKLIKYGEFSELIIDNILNDKMANINTWKDSILKLHKQVFHQKINKYDQQEIIDVFSRIEIIIDDFHPKIKEINTQITTRYQNFVIRPDIIIDNCVYDIKEVSSLRKVSRSISFQLLLYFSILSLSSNNTDKITHMGIIAPNKSAIIKFDMSQWISQGMSTKFLQYVTWIPFQMEEMEKVERKKKIKLQCYDIPALNSKDEQKDVYDMIMKELGPISIELPYQMLYFNSTTSEYESLISTVCK